MPRSLRILRRQAECFISYRRARDIPSQAASRDQLARQARERIGLALYGEAA